MYQYFSSQGHIFPKIPSPALIKRIPQVIGTKSSLAAAPFDTADGCCKSLVHSLTHSPGVRHFVIAVAAVGMMIDGRLGAGPASLYLRPRPDLLLSERQFKITG